MRARFKVIVAGILGLLGLWGSLISVGILSPMGTDKSGWPPAFAKAISGQWCSTDANNFLRDARLELSYSNGHIKATSTLKVPQPFGPSVLSVFEDGSAKFFTVEGLGGFVFAPIGSNNALTLEIYRQSGAEPDLSGEFLHRHFYKRCA